MCVETLADDDDDSLMVREKLLAPIFQNVYRWLSQSITTNGRCLQEKLRYNDHRRTEKKTNERKTKIKFNMKCIRMRYTCHRSKCVEVLANDRPQIPKRHSIATVDVLMRGCE